MFAYTLWPPADSPKIVTRFGSPPKPAMLLLNPLERELLIHEAVVAVLMAFGIDCDSAKKPKVRGGS